MRRAARLAGGVLGKRRRLRGAAAARRSPASARSAHATRLAVLTDAVDRDVLAINPALRLPLALFLATAERLAGELAGLYFAMGRAGLRVGEAIGLQHEDVVATGTRRQLVIRGTVRMGGRIGPPKDGTTRVVDMTESLARILAHAERRSSWIFPRSAAAAAARSATARCARCSARSPPRRASRTRAR